MFINSYSKLQKKNASNGNYLKFDINARHYVIYENAELNNDTVPSTFSFQFGQSTFTNSPLDTTISIRGCLNRINLSIEFPKTDKPKKFNIYRYLNQPAYPSCFYQFVVDHPDTGIIVYETRNISNIRSYDTIKVGEINITRANASIYEFEGTFYFKAYSYLHRDGIISSIGDSVEIKNGEFYYKRK